MRRVFSCAVFLAILALAFPGVAAVTQTEMVPMADGVRLSTDVFLPTQGAGPWPVVLVRTPYDKAQSRQTGDDLQKSNLVATVIQDLRGRFASEGTDCIFTCDADDGKETVEWILAQPWSNGKVLTFGGSALGIVQYLLAGTNPPGLTGMIVEVATPDLYDFMFPGGVWRQSDVEGWLQGQGSTFWLENVKAHPLMDAFWDPVTVSKRYASVNVPAIHVGGWYDIFTQGTLNAFAGFQEHGGAGAKGKQKLVIGPWTHGGRDVNQGELTYPASSTQDAIKLGDLFVSWMLHHLDIQDKSAMLDAVPTVQYYAMGACGEQGAPGNEWRSADVWPPPAAPVRWYLAQNKVLTSGCPTSAAAASYTYDPSAPNPTYGGANLTQLAGPYDQTWVESFTDIAVFTTAALVNAVEVTGRVKAHLFVSIDTPDTDLMVRLTDVYPDGRSMLVTDGALRLATRGTRDTLTPLTPGEIYEAVIDVGSTSMIFNKGHKIRIIVSSSNSPRFRPNPNDGTNYGETATPKPVQVTLHHDKDHLSYLETPDPNKAPAEVNLCTDFVSCGTGYDRDAYEDKPCGSAGIRCQLGQSPCYEWCYYIDCLCSENNRWSCAWTDCGCDGGHPIDDVGGDPGDTYDAEVNTDASIELDAGLPVAQDGGTSDGGVGQYTDTPPGPGSGCSCASVGL